jgi:hypothetical protein
MKGVLAHGLLALLGLLFAYRTWTHEDKDEPVADLVTVAECSPNELSAIEVETPTHWVRFKAKKGADKEPLQYWVTAQRKPPEEDKKPDANKDAKPETDKTAKPDAKKDEPAAAAKPATHKNAKPEPPKPADAAPKPPEPPKVARPFNPNAPVTFLASPKFEERRKSLAPLRAMRAIGEVKPAKFSDFGFDKVGTYLRMTCGNRKIALDVGARTYGLADQYVRDPKTKQVYLLNGQIVMDLESAQFKFTQTDLHDFPMTEVDATVIKAAGKELRLVQRNRLTPEDARWVDAAAPDKRNELFGNWFQRLDKMKIKSFLDEGAEPGSDLAIEARGMLPVLTMSYELEGKKKGSLELVRVDTAQGGFYYARSEATHRWVTLYDSLAKQVEEDVPLLVGAEEPAAQSQSESSPSEPPSQAQPAPASPHEPTSPHGAAAPHEPATTHVPAPHPAVTH